MENLWISIWKLPMPGLVSGCCLLAQGGSPAQLIFSSTFAGEPGPCHDLPLSPRSGLRVPHGVLPSPCHGSALQEGQILLRSAALPVGTQGVHFGRASSAVPFLSEGMWGQGTCWWATVLQLLDWERLRVRPHQVDSCYQNLLSGVF